MRTIRDIPANNILAGSKTSNLRQIILENAEKEGWKCNCIRCREVGNASNYCSNEVRTKDANSSQQASNNKIILFTEEYEASAGKEYFLSYETEDRKLFSLLRLRLTKDQFMPKLMDAALIREVHTYGQEAEVGDKGDTQHRGFGKKLIAEAEKIARSNGYKKIAVISGVGVRDYYRKFGYKLDGEYMVKDL
jgi:elongator complex protein 3